MPPPPPPPPPIVNRVKMSYKELVIPLFHICKNSMKLGIFPDEMEIAKIKPLFKAGERDIGQYLFYQYFLNC